MSEKSDRETTISPDTVSDDTATLRILIVDDDPGIADIIADVLREPGKTVRAAEDGMAAIRLAEELKPDIVLLDIKLPDMDGYELARRIRKLSDGSAPFIIATSGYTPERESKEEMFDEYLIKPIDFTRLKELIATRLVRAVNGSVRE